MLRKTAVVDARLAPVDELVPKGSFRFEGPLTRDFWCATSLSHAGFHLKVCKEVVGDNDDLRANLAGILPMPPINRGSAETAFRT